MRSVAPMLARRCCSQGASARGALERAAAGTAESRRRVSPPPARASRGAALASRLARRCAGVRSAVESRRLARSACSALLAHRQPFASAAACAAHSRLPAPASDSAAAADDPSLPPSQRNVVDILRERGLLDACTSEAGLRAACAPGGPPQRVYCGFDPTADSLHAGNLLGIVVLAWFQRCGHTPVALVGGATGRVGDPSGKSSERPLLDEETLEANVAGIARLLGALLPASAEGGGGAPIVLNNMDWFGGFSLLDFLRDVGRYARVGVMLSKDSVKSRMVAAPEGGEQAEGMSFTEFSYQLLQAFDFAHLFKHHGVTVQVGGSDQWGNITAGTDLIRRAQAREGAFGLTFPLLLRSDGKKFGKSEEGAVWLSAHRLSPYAFYQHWLRVPDADAPLFLRRLTFLPLAAVEELEARRQAGRLSAPNEAQLLLAAELTRFVHGEEGLTAALRATEGLAPGAAGGAPLDAQALEALGGEVPSVSLPAAEVMAMSVAELLAAAGLQPTKAAARRLIKGGGVYLNNGKVGDEHARLAAEDAVGGRLILLAAGKKNKCLVRLL